MQKWLINNPHLSGGFFIAMATYSFGYGHVTKDGINFKGIMLNIALCVLWSVLIENCKKTNKTK